MSAEKNIRLKQRVDTNNNWKTKNPLLLTKEIGFSLEQTTKTTQLNLPLERSIKVGFNGTSQNWNDAPYIYHSGEEWLTWGGRDTIGSNHSPMDNALISELPSNNIFAFMPAEALSVEYSTDGGKNWTEFNATDDEKTHLVTKTYNRLSGLEFGVGGIDYSRIPEGSELRAATEQDALRVTINFTKTSIYAVLKKIAIEVNCCALEHGYTITLQGSRDGQNWEIIDDKNSLPIYGWSHWNIINTNVVINSATVNNQINYLRFLFNKTNSIVSEGYSSALGLCGIYAYASNQWNVSYAPWQQTGHLYKYDIDKTAAFPNSLGIGFSNKYTGLQSLANGSSTNASGTFSHAEGYATIASGENSHAEGHVTIASGENSHAEGYVTIASGNGAYSSGINTNASGAFSHVEGYGMTGGLGLVNTSYGAIGDYSHAENCQTTASGENSHSEGYHTIASGDTSHAEGNYTEASGDTSHAEGYHTEASGDTSHAEGNYTIAKGQYSHAENFYTQALGDFSHAEGQGTIARGLAQHVLGIYNAPDTTSAVIVGNGTYDKTSNIYTLDWNGNGWYKNGIIIGDEAVPLKQNIEVICISGVKPTSAFNTSKIIPFYELTAESINEDNSILCYDLESIYPASIYDINIKYDSILVHPILNIEGDWTIAQKLQKAYMNWKPYTIQNLNNLYYKADALTMDIPIILEVWRKNGNN